MRLFLNILPNERIKYIYNRYYLELLLSLKYKFKEEEEFFVNLDCNVYNPGVFGVYNLDEDPYLLKAYIAQQEFLELDEEEYFDKNFWLDQFFYDRIYDIDLTSPNPIVINFNKKKFELFNYSNERIDYMDNDILDNNSFKYFYFIYNLYSYKSFVYTRFDQSVPYFSNFSYSYFRHYPRISEDLNVDYHLGLDFTDEGFYHYYKLVYLGFQLKDCFFLNMNKKFFIKIMNPYESFDNIFKFNFFSNLEFFINTLQLKNFPNLTKKEYERILFFF